MSFIVATRREGKTKAILRLEAEHAYHQKWITVEEFNEISNANLWKPNGDGQRSCSVNIELYVTLNARLIAAKLLHGKESK